MPTAFMSMLPRPCATGLLRPKRLFEVDGTTGGAPSSHCGLEARGGHGLPPATAPSIMPESAPRELQEGDRRRRWRGQGPSAPSTLSHTVDGAVARNTSLRARGAPSTMLRMVPACNSRPADSGMMLGAVAGGRPCPPRASSPQWELGAPPVVPSTSNSRLGRKSPVAQGRGSMDMKAVGIDVSKDRLDVHLWPDGIAFAVARDGKSLAELIERLLPLTPDLVVVEATGGFETVVAAALAGAGLPLVVANPAQIRHFAQAAGTRAKTDPIDAAMIARFGHDMKPDVRPLPDEATQLLADLVARRRQIIEMIVAERNRERRATVRRIKKSIARLIRALEKELAEIDAEIDAGVRGSPAWRDKEDLLASVPGVGPVVARTLIAELPELGTLRQEED